MCTVALLWGEKLPSNAHAAAHVLFRGWLLDVCVRYSLRTSMAAHKAWRRDMGGDTASQITHVPQPLQARGVYYLIREGFSVWRKPPYMHGKR